MDHVFFVARSKLTSIRRQRARAYYLQAPDGAPMRTDEAFRDLVVKIFPMNPPLGAKNYVPGAMSDSLFGGLISANEPVVDIIWPFADSTPLRFLMDKVSLLNQTAVWCNPNDPEAIKNDDGGVDIRIILVCSNEKNREALESRFLQ